ncbi:Cupin 2, conserved barrel domain protein [Rhizorhabdus wittichii RW1]|uniref:Cupin 2, conserved barrel domain protein n=2 Tax=Rhizorhabdus wittichii TaxID=160791 RepID=A0A9J9HAM2_RHIWR|nr:Cupin 2, conserved barrel domain protein [Rhizorhabdus wittichii RW1]
MLAADAVHALGADAPGCRALVSSFAAGLRVPAEGSSRHDEIEISLVLSGAFDLDSGGEVARLAAGDVVIVPPGEAHSFQVVADTRIFTVTVAAG